MKGSILKTQMAALGDESPLGDSEIPQRRGSLPSPTSVLRPALSGGLSFLHRSGSKTALPSVMASRAVSNGGVITAQASTASLSMSDAAVSQALDHAVAYQLPTEASVLTGGDILEGTDGELDESALALLPGRFSRQLQQLASFVKAPQSVVKRSRCGCKLLLYR